MTKLEAARAVRRPNRGYTGPMAADLMERLDVVLACLRGDITFNQAAAGLGLPDSASQTSMVPILRECVHRGVLTFTVSGTRRGAA